MDLLSGNALSRTLRRFFVVGLLVVGGATLVIGCEETLTETPESFVAPDNFFQNEDQARAALNGVYKTLHRQLGQATLTVFEQPALPVSSVDDRGTPEGAANLWSWGQGHRGTRSVWPHLYDGINTANTFLANVQDVPGMSEDLKTQFAAEARFIRAWHHFELLHLFGNIPLKTEPATSPVREVPQASPSEVYDFLLSELDEIQSQLPPITEYSGSQKARINRSAAKVLLAKVYLQRASGHPPGVSSGGSDLSNAEGLLREVMASENFTLVDSYADLFLDPATNDRNEEVIFSAEHMQIGGQGTAVENFLHPPNSDWGIGQWTTHHSNFDFLLSYNDGDVRKDVAWLTEYEDPSGQTRTYDPFDPKNDTYQVDGAILRKLIYEGQPTLGWTEGWRDWMYFRYADVLLMLAETINRQGGPTSEAYDLVDQVRARAGAPNLERGLSQAQFSDSLYQERMWEFNQEFHGWRDCQRFFERCKELVEESSQRAVQEDGPNNLRRYNAGDRPIEIETPKRRLWAIPSNALDRNAALEQNPGY
jgi:hypothetical protein